MVSKEEIFRNLESVRALIPEGVGLVAVSKFQPAEAIRDAYEAGQRTFGESRVLELLEKIPQLPADINWHFIGHLQTNKVKMLIGKTALIESVDSNRLLDVIQDCSTKAGIKTDILLQVHVAREETKFGFLPEELKSFFRERTDRKYTHINFRGLMAMATNTDDETVVRKDFATVADLFREVKTQLAPDLADFQTLSMGMSGDWPIAVEEGANLVRIGSAIFGER